MFDSLSFKTPTNVEKCHINEAKYFLNIFYTYQDFRLGGFMFHRAIDWIPLPEEKFASQWLDWKFRNGRRFKLGLGKSKLNF